MASMHDTFFATKTIFTLSLPPPHFLTGCKILQRHELQIYLKVPNDFFVQHFSTAIFQVTGKPTIFLAIP